MLLHLKEFNITVCKVSQNQAIKLMLVPVLVRKTVEEVVPDPAKAHS
jgi:hypothetical protein